MGFKITLPEIMYIAVVVVVAVSIAESLDSNKILLKVFSPSSIAVNGIHVIGPVASAPTLFVFSRAYSGAETRLLYNMAV
jgi:hypothetical protein